MGCAAGLPSQITAILIRPTQVERSSQGWTSTPAGRMDPQPCIGNLK